VANARVNADVVQATVVGIAGGDGAIGVSVKRGIDCILVRVGPEVEVSSPGSVSKVYRLPGESSCQPLTALQRGYQHAPH
jgi:hypothetical protein